ncbi:MAG: hypothetical protein GY835_17690 [bacterium]|nr:hypothetical protein [bacterium]
MKRFLTAILLTSILISSAQAESADLLSDWAAVGDEIPSPEDSRPLSTLFMEWGYLSDWVRSELRGTDTAELPGRWARLHDLRHEDDPLPVWRRQRVRRGVCLFERLAPSPAELESFCDSLLTHRFNPEAVVIEGILIGFLLQERALPGCGEDGDPARHLSGALGPIPGRNLVELKEGQDYAQLFFDAELDIERHRLKQLERVREFLAEPGLLISLKYGYHKIRDLESAVAPERVDEKHWIYPAGVTIDWGSGRRYEVTDLAVLHNPTQHLFQIKESRPRIRLMHNDERISSEFGEYELSGSYVLETDHLTMVIDGGRYRRDDDELRIWWPGSFFASNKSGLLMALLILIVIMILLANIQRQKRALARPIKIRRKPKL